jgi:hypothetical protein
MKTQIYSWRLSEELKSDLEREARLRKLPVAAVLEVAVRDWLKKSGEDVAGDQAQRKLHAAIEDCIGIVAGGDPRRSEKVRETVRKRLRKGRRVR